MTGPFDAIKAAVVLLVGAMLGWLLANLYAEAVSLPAAREAGELQERVKWTEEQNRARAKLEADRRATQAKVDEQERELHARDQARQADMDELEAALAAERADNDAAPIPTPSPGAPRACRPAVSRGVRDKLQNLGRDAAPRNNPAGAQAPLR